MNQQNQFIYLVLLMMPFLISCREEIPRIDDLEKIPAIKIQSDVPVNWDTKVPCTLTFDAGSTHKILDAHIKFRGGSSSKYEKHSFSVELAGKYDFLWLPHDDDWILNASYIDKTFMRHKISYDLFRQMNSNNISSESIYVNLEFNGAPRGLYLLMEEVNAGMAGLDKSDPLAMMFKDPPVFYETSIPNPQDPLNYYQQKFPKIYDSDKTWYINEFRDFLFNSTDDAFLKKINEWVDVRNITDWHILLLLTNNSDGIMKNFYLYKLNTATPFRIAIWDYDHSFGRDGDNELNMMERELDCNRSVLFRRLMEIPGSKYPQNLKQRWLELRKADIVSVDNILAHISGNDKIIQEEIKNNSEIWPVDSKWYYDSNGYFDELEIIKKFVELRIAQLDSSFSIL